jgi:hypothetical protein
MIARKDPLSIRLFPIPAGASQIPSPQGKKDARPLTPNSFSARGTGQCARRNGFTKGRRPGKMFFSN